MVDHWLNEQSLLHRLIEDDHRWVRDVIRERLPAPPHEIDLLVVPGGLQDLVDGLLRDDDWILVGHANRCGIMIGMRTNAYILVCSFPPALSTTRGCGK